MKILDAAQISRIRFSLTIPVYWTVGTIAMGGDRGGGLPLPARCLPRMKRRGVAVYGGAKN
ncbi:hypothetical protein ASZ90_008849 [hydrocarbon metagenome]|uniref:Uncharacterized protein n=1 Tax=hydrocarbon metagenome TaxID=938273 RepID=A0A0W8FL04_9ZZZZ